MFFMNKARTHSADFSSSRLTLDPWRMAVAPKVEAPTQICSQLVEHLDLLNMHFARVANVPNMKKESKNQRT